jgi:hypothetical protein
VPSGYYDISIDADYYQNIFIPNDFIDYNSAVTYEIGLIPLSYNSPTPFPTINPSNLPATPTPTINPNNSTDFFSDNYWHFIPGTMGLIIAGLIILFCAAIAGYAAKGSALGLFGGAVIGFVISAGLRLIDQSMIILFIILAVLGVAIILFYPRGGGSS